MGIKFMTDSFFRKFKILTEIPEPEKRIGTVEIQKKLKTNYDIHASLRTIQRDLKSLADIFPFLKNDGEKGAGGQGWFWAKESGKEIFPAVGPNTALAFQLIQKYLSDKLPKAALNAISVYFDHANQRLCSEDSVRYRKWIKKIALLPRTSRQ
jgi:hypothetical protein